MTDLMHEDGQLLLFDIDALRSEGCKSREDGDYSPTAARGDHNDRADKLTWTRPDENFLLAECGGGVFYGIFARTLTGRTTYALWRGHEYMGDFADAEAAKRAAEEIEWERAAWSAENGAGARN